MEGFDVREATVKSVHHALFSGSTTCRAIVEAFIARIEAFNPMLNAIINLNPDALTIADEKDAEIAAGTAKGALFGNPVLLKDNYDTNAMPTTGGCLALANSQPTVDAPVVRALKKAGAIIIGKTNMHELALEGLTVSSLGGQTLNPYDFTRTPGGSSGGTGAAIAASFAVFGTGTDTMNSLRSPASANSLFSIRPTRGLISRTGLIPISSMQDVAGPIARNVEDLAVALTFMASVGRDPDDEATALIPESSIGVDYATAIQEGSLDGMRLGLADGFFNHSLSEETSPVNNILDEMVGSLSTAGVTIIPIASDIFDSTAILKACDTQRFEFRQNMDVYLSRPSLQGDHPSTLDKLYSSGKFLVIPRQYEHINASLTSSANDNDYASFLASGQNLNRFVEEIFAQNKLDALIYPEQANLVVTIASPSQCGRNGILAAVTDFPAVAVPAGFSPATADAPIGVPIGMEILGLKWQEEKLLRIARLVAEIKPVRKMPQSTEAVVEGRRLVEVPTVVPDAGNIPDVYPVGIR
ncbi:hypothetical protein MMC21_005982 [Puttea exsequens]|nr:hypothetical protein [Puttea exsequens]